MDGTYELPVSKLLWIGEPTRKWQNYAILGLTAEHVSELCRMVRDPMLEDLESDTPNVWATAHAWRALSELRAPGLLDAMLDRLDRFDANYWDDQFLSDFSTLAARLGPNTLPLLIRYLHDHAKPGDNRLSVASAIAAVAEAHPEVRRSAVAALEQTLSDSDRNPPEVNGMVIAALVDLGSLDSIDLIREVMHKGHSSEMFAGRLEQIEFDLGLRDRPPERQPWRLVPRDDDESRPDDWGANEWGTAPQPLGAPTKSEAGGKRNARERARARRKVAKAARKRNRSK
jgi:hypothetical protein